jgi:hypothetical protein
MSDTADTDIKTLLDLGKAARRGMYVELLQRVNRKESLTPSDFKVMRELEAEFSDMLAPDAPTAPVKTFPNLLKALDYLHEQGYRAKKSSLYNHRKSGLLNPNSSGCYEAVELDRYAAANLTRIGQSVNDPAQDRLEKLQQDRLEATTKIAQEQLRLLENRNADFDSKIDSRVGQELVKREAFFKVYLVNYFTSEAPAFIETVHGDPQYIPEFIELSRRGINAALGNLVRYKGMTIMCSPSGEILTA